MTQARASVPRNLFRPGAGGFPPHFAGRKKALDDLAPLQASLREGEAPSQDVVLYGPRGNGKTVLMREFLRRSSDISGLQVIRLTPDKVPDLPALCRNVVQDRPGRRLLERIQAVRRVDVSLSETGLPGLGIEFDTPAETRLLPDILRDRIKKGPLVLALDEAHTLDLKVGQTLLNLVQDMRDENRPVLLMLAGTPGLKTRLGAMEASFWDRCCDVAVGRLGEKDSSAALTVPLKRHGVSVAADALRTVVEESHGYPYFLQLWGLALTRDLREGERIAEPQVSEAHPLFEDRQRVYYLNRHNELRRRSLLPSAEALAGAFGPGEGAGVGEDALLKALRSRTDTGAAADVLDGLVQLGYVWQDATGDYVPGIPSLMDYVRERQASAHAGHGPEEVPPPAPKKN